MVDFTSKGKPTILNNKIFIQLLIELNELYAHQF